MRSRHVGFFVEQAYGHIIPTLGIALELIRRGHRVSYAVSANFSQLVRRCGANAIVFEPMETRTALWEAVTRADAVLARPDTAPYVAVEEQLRNARTADSVGQFERLYAHDKPDLVVHDDCLDLAGKTLARKWRIATVRHEPVMLSRRRIHRYARSDDELILVSVPEFLNEDPDAFDQRFKSIGFTPEGRREFAQPWTHATNADPTILVCPTTGLVPQVEFCRLAIEAFRGLPLNVVLSIPSELDPVSAIDPASLGELPKNFRLNRYSSNLDILARCAVFIGQGGQGSALEALYCGVAPILVPQSLAHDVVARRVSNLGLGVRLPAADASPENLRKSAFAIMSDPTTRDRVRDAQRSMQAAQAARVAADLIELRLPAG